MDPLSWFKTRAQLAGLLAATVLFLVTTGALSFVLVTTKWDLKRTRGDLMSTQEQLADANTALGVCQAARDGLQVSINEQNQRIQALKEEAGEAEKAGLRKLAEAVKKADVYRTKAEKLARAKPADPANVCSSARTLIVDTLSEERAP